MPGKKQSSKRKMTMVVKQHTMDLNLDSPDELEIPSAPGLSGKAKSVIPTQPDKVLDDDKNAKNKPKIGTKRQHAIKEAIGQLIGPTEIAPEVMMLFKELKTEQGRMFE